MVPSERSVMASVVGYLLMLGLISVPVAMVYTYVDGEQKRAVLFIFGYLLLFFTLLKLVQYYRRSLKNQPPSPVEMISLREDHQILTTRAFEDIRNRIRYSAQSRRYFHRVLKPRLLNILGHRLRARYGIAINSHGEDLSRFLDQESMALLLDEKGRGLLKRRIPLSQIRTLLKKIKEL